MASGLGGVVLYEPSCCSQKFLRQFLFVQVRVPEK